MENENKSFDPQDVDNEYYSKDPYQHGDSDYGRVSEGVGNNSYKSATSGMDMDTENQEYIAETREANKHEGNPALPTGETIATGTMEWDVDAEAVERGHNKPHPVISDEAAKKFSEIAENPSDDALFHRADATYLEQGDHPGEGYDPHHMGYDAENKDKEKE
ncbi:hypothetical protein [Arsenicibacter rosenii]|uniref:Uncharacterized protein n=1 Tax=Arsenicibacter rosenii TaxID=1750698 RepID=A0A1S2VMQ9_9BACT|nr:hypothetical protein [Arsenicibacter rosenii]OIN60053.1 hypothetical protein BLX24_04170 [Arsenicibacter rosenii]